MLCDVYGFALLSHSLPRRIFASAASEHIKKKSRKQELAKKADVERRRCQDWLMRFVRDGQPKVMSKAELRQAAMRDLKISKHSFDFAWIWVIEATGRHDWYEPLRRRRQTRS